MLLKDVFDYSLEEIADLVDSTVGGVKAALHRGRSKLATKREDAASPRPRREQETRLLGLYVERFNLRDWDGLRELIADDARLRVADRYAGTLSESPYFGNYERVPTPWQMAAGEVDGQPVVVILHGTADVRKPAAVIRLDVTDGRITRIADYWHCPWMLPAATSLVISERC